MIRLQAPELMRLQGEKSCLESGEERRAEDQQADHQQQNDEQSFGHPRLGERWCVPWSSEEVWPGRLLIA